MNGNGSEKPLAYLDSNIFFRLYDDKASKDVLDALEKLADNDAIELVTSKETMAELQREERQIKRVTFKLLYRLIKKAKEHSLTYQEEVGAWGTMQWGDPWGGGIVTCTKPLFTELRRIFPDEPDAKHIAQAIMENCNYFVTLDKKTIINKAVPHSKLLLAIGNGIQFLTPQELALALEKNP
jgi:predicted nucleic acid-binding protein